MTEPTPRKDPTKTPKAPRAESESMPPAGGESMQPRDSRRPAAAPDEARDREGDERDPPEATRG